MNIAPKSVCADLHHAGGEHDEGQIALEKRLKGNQERREWERGGGGKAVELSFVQLVSNFVGREPEGS